MRRTGLAVVLALGLALVPLAAAARQAGVVPRVGYISTAPVSPFSESWWEAFRSALQEKGWVDRQNIAIDRRVAAPRKEAATAIAEELVRAGIDVIVASSTLNALAAKQATATVPIVVTVPADPVATGLVASLARPGGNVTGLSFVGTELAGKQVQLLQEAIPGLAQVVVIANPTNASHAVSVKEKPSYWLIPCSFLKRAALFARRRAAAPRHVRVREIVVAGGLMSYAADFTDLVGLLARHRPHCGRNAPTRL